MEQLIMSTQSFDISFVTKSGTAKNSMDYMKTILTADPVFMQEFVMTDEQIIGMERRIYEQKKEEYLNRNLEGKYIAQLNGEIIDSDDDFNSLAKRVYDKHGYVAIFMTQVLRNEKVHRVSPKFVSP